VTVARHTIGVKEIVVVDAITPTSRANGDLNVLRPAGEPAGNPCLRILIVAEGVRAPKRKQVFVADGSDTAPGTGSINRARRSLLRPGAVESASRAGKAFSVARNYRRE
jgi:hypothetical protein